MGEGVRPPRPDRDAGRADLLRGARNVHPNLDGEDPQRAFRLHRGGDCRVRGGETEYEEGWRVKRWQWIGLGVLTVCLIALYVSGRFEELMLALSGAGLVAASKLAAGRRETDKASEETRRTITKLEDLRKQHEEEVQRIEEAHKHRTVDDVISRANERERRGDTTIR